MAKVDPRIEELNRLQRDVAFLESNKIVDTNAAMRRQAELERERIAQIKRELERKGVHGG